MGDIKKIIKNPLLLFGSLGHRGFFNWMSDEQYLKILYKTRMGKPLNLDNPQTFNEKLQWLKLYDHNPEYTTMVDKYAAKKWVADRIGGEYIIPTLGVWEHFDDIDFDKLPDQFVLKCNHDSGGLVICRNKSKLDINSARKKINKCLKHNYYWGNREWPYKNVQPCIIAEKYMEDTASKNLSESERCLTDYKFFCFNGIPKIVYISKDHASEPSTDFFDMEYAHLPLRMRDPNSETPPAKPNNFGEMKELAEVLSKGIPFLRVDFYSVDGKIYAGELTFYHCSGFAPIFPKEWEVKLGEWIELPNSAWGGVHGN